MVEQSEPGSPAPRLGLSLRRRDVVGLLVGLVVLGVVLALVFRGPAAIRAPGGVAATASGGPYDGLALAREEATPPLALDNYLGTPVNIAGYRGKAVLVTFLYTHCPDVCPLIASHLHTALTEMPAAERRRLQIIAVSVDPRGDTQTTVAAFLAAHELTGQMQYLIGSSTALKHVWRRWGIADAPTASAANPDLVAHTALVYGITARGRIAVLYASNFTPGEIVHDARVLADA
jgi:protein SCO1/2